MDAAPVHYTRDDVRELRHLAQTNGLPPALKRHLMRADNDPAALAYFAFMLPGISRVLYTAAPEDLPLIAATEPRLAALALWRLKRGA